MATATRLTPWGRPVRLSVPSLRSGSAGRLVDVPPPAHSREVADHRRDTRTLAPGLARIEVEPEKFILEEYPYGDCQSHNEQCGWEIVAMSAFCDPSTTAINVAAIRVVLPLYMRRPTSRLEVGDGARGKSENAARGSLGVSRGRDWHDRLCRSPDVQERPDQQCRIQRRLG
jgi:hypothetical protein